MRDKISKMHPKVVFLVFNIVTDLAIYLFIQGKGLMLQWKNNATSVDWVFSSFKYMKTNLEETNSKREVPDGANLTGDSWRKQVLKRTEKNWFKKPLTFSKLAKNRWLWNKKN